MYDDELYHYGIKGMKWGRRRFETASGHLTSAGKKRYLRSDIKPYFPGAVVKGDGVSFSKPKYKKPIGTKDESGSYGHTVKLYTRDRYRTRVGRGGITRTKLSSKGRRKTKKLLSKIGNKSIRAVGYASKTGVGVVKSLYNISDTGQRMNQTRSYTTLASQMSPEYRKRYLY